MTPALQLPGDLLREVYASARRHAPHEIVGILAGTRHRRVTHVLELPNLVGTGGHLAEPRAQYEAEMAIRRLQLSLLAVYHSHPRGGTDPSPLDVAFAGRRPNVAHVIVAVDRPTADDAIASYLAVGGHLLPDPIIVRDGHHVTSLP